MTDELTKTFFDKFGIEPMPYCCYHDCNCPINDVGKFNSKCPKQAVTKECDARIIQKPQITDRILLELICILADLYDSNFRSYPLSSKDIKELKEDVLDDLMGAIDVENDYPEGYAKKVRTLFEEVE